MQFCLWTLQGHVYSFRSFKINRTNYMKAFLTGSRFAKPCCALVWHAEERLSVKNTLAKGRAWAAGSWVSHKSCLLTCILSSLDLSCMQLNHKAKTPSKTLGLSLHAHLIPPALCLQQSLKLAILPGHNRMVWLVADRFWGLSMNINTDSENSWDGCHRQCVTQR